MTRLAVILAAAVASCHPAVAAAAVCGSRDSIVTQLAEGFGEHVAWRGVRADGQLVVEVYTNPETGSWTLVTTDTGGQSCAVADGMAGHDVAPVVPPVPGKDA